MTDKEKKLCELLGELIEYIYVENAETAEYFEQETAKIIGEEYYK